MGSEVAVIGKHEMTGPCVTCHDIVCAVDICSGLDGCTKLLEQSSGFATSAALWLSLVAVYVLAIRASFP